MQVLILNEKHGTRYIFVPNKEQLLKIITAVISKRNSEEWWYTDLDPKEKSLLNQALMGNSQAKFKFFAARQKAEYEGWDLADLEEI